MAVNTKRELCGQTANFKTEAKNKKRDNLGGQVKDFNLD